MSEKTLGATGMKGTVTLSLTQSISHLDKNDRIVDGLRIPANLDNTLAVNFVLTQEPGKLKPKDLKIAIEKNRAEREHRAEEQRKLREQGGGAGVLDLRGILAEERLNADSSSNDPFKRQLREMAFLADVEEVEKQEIEKEFRISEDFIGSDLLSVDDIKMIQRQREISRIHKKRTEWRRIHSRQHTVTYTGPMAPVRAGPQYETTEKLMAILTPSFDPNRNDIWAKRLNTLRRFVSIVSRWIVRKRVNERMKKVMTRFHQNNAYTREEIRAFIEKENLDNKNSASSSGSAEDEEEKEAKRQAKLAARASTAGGGDLSATHGGAHSLETLTLADIIFAEMHPTIIKRQRNEEILRQSVLATKRGQPEFTKQMLRRNLFPVFDRNSLKFPQHEVNLYKDFLKDPVKFDDHSYFHLKTKPDYISYGYQPHPLPQIPIHFPTAHDKKERVGGLEEGHHRSSADVGISLAQLEKVLSTANVVVEDTETVIRLKKETEQVMRDVHRERLLAEGIEEDKLGINGEEAPIMDPDFLTMKDFSPIWLQASASMQPTNTLLHPPTEVANENTVGKWDTLKPKEIIWQKKDLDFFTVLPTYRSYNPLLRRVETDSDWILRPTRADDDELHYHQDDSLRTQWMHQQEKPNVEGEPPKLPPANFGGNFSSVNTYLLGQAESRWRDEKQIPPIGPTLLFDYYHPDHDRHASGLNCFRQDHLRNTNEWDPDVLPPQENADPEDYLTDSESDNDDEFAGDGSHISHKITVKQVKKMLKPSAPPEPVAVVDPKAKGKDAKGKAAPAPTPAPVAQPEDDEGELDFAALTEKEKKEEQVELMRDRKTLDLESTWTRSRQKMFDEVSKRLQEVSKQSQCVITALPVQLPFHQYEDEVYKLFNNNASGRVKIPELSNNFIEVDPKASVTQMPSTTGLLSSPNLHASPGSPEKK